MRQIAASKFKEQCLALLEEVGPEGIVITKRGKPVAKLVPADPPRPRSVFGCMADLTEIVGDVENDTIEGRVEYRAATTTPQNPDCSSIQGCLSFQEFNGTRPPT